MMVKVMDAPVMPATVTTTGPVVAAVGTTAVICVSPHAVTEAGSPLKVMVLLLCTDPKPVPLTTTVEFTGPEDGDNPVIVGAPSTVRLTALLVTPKRVTVSGPLTAPFGTWNQRLVSLQADGPIAMPPMLIVRLEHSETRTG